MIKKQIKIFLSKIIGILSIVVTSLIQYVPSANIWFGIMSLPFISYIFYLSRFPSILWYDFQFFFKRNFTLSLFGFFGLILFICSLVYQLLNRKKFICNGPYKYIRHPQYTGILIFTFCLTLISLNTSPIPLITENDYFPKSFLIYIWLMELSSYVFLAKIEEAWLKKKFGKLYDSYIKKTGFFFPKVNLHFKEKKQNKEIKESRGVVPYQNQEVSN